MYKLLDFRHNPAKFLNHSTTFDMLRRRSGRDTKTSEKTGVAASDLGPSSSFGRSRKTPSKEVFSSGKCCRKEPGNKLLTNCVHFFRKFQLNWEKSNTPEGVMHLSIVCPWMGGEGGQPTGYLTFSGFQFQFSHPWISTL